MGIDYFIQEDPWPSVWRNEIEDGIEQLLE
jgi:hypothetical protein